jgi:sensor histidine kinase YesM
MKDMIFVNDITAGRFIHFGTMAASLVSLFTIFSIALDRYMLTVHPFTHRVLVNGRRIAICIASIWLISLYYLIKASICGLHIVDSTMYFMIFTVIASLTGLIYLVTFFALRKQGRDISQNGQCRNRALQKKFFKTIAIVAFIQIFTNVPTTVAGSISTLSHGPRDVSRYGIAAVILYQILGLNFVVNPFLYIWRLKNYRRTFCLVFCRKPD